MPESPWRLSDRFDPAALPLADRHYNRQKPGSPQFVPPGRCLVLLTADRSALWVTSWPFAQYVRHAWGGAWGGSATREVRLSFRPHPRWNLHIRTEATAPEDFEGITYGT